MNIILTYRCDDPQKKFLNDPRISQSSVNHDVISHLPNPESLYIIIRLASAGAIDRHYYDLGIYIILLYYYSDLE